MKTLTITLAAALLLLSGCGSDSSDTDTLNKATAYTPPQPTGIDESDQPPSPPRIR